MASLRSPALRQLLISSNKALRAVNQRRWAQVHDVRFLATTQQPRAIAEKYQDKLDRKAREEGYANAEALRAAYADKIEELKKKATVEIPTIDQAPPTQLHTPPPSPGGSPPPPPPRPVQQKASSSKTPSSGIKPLADILDLEKARELPAKELTAIWRLRYAHTPNTLSAVINAPTYESMAAAARRNPQFVLPVPRDGQGAEIHFLQWVFDAETRTSSVMFTQLAEFKARGEYAQPHTTITHHVDLADGPAGLVLMQGQLVEGRGASIDDARWLVMCLQRFYGGWDGEGAADPKRLERAVERRRLLEYFSQADPRFSVDKLLEEAERMG
jgi:ATP synthase F1 complex assembly factor 1